MLAILLQNNAREWLRRLLISGLWLWFTASAFPQRSVRTIDFNGAGAEGEAVPAATISAALLNVASRAAVGFTGRVTKIKRIDDVVDVTFAVDAALVGTPGSTYTVREWAGLSPMGQSHYSLGQRVAIFLHAPGRSGLSSPVDGQEGIVPVVQQAADQPALLDLRRLATRVQRAKGQPMLDEQTSAITLSDARALVSRTRRAPFEPILRCLPIVIEHPVAVRVGEQRVQSDLIFVTPAGAVAE